MTRTNSLLLMLLLLHGCGRDGRLTTVEGDTVAIPGGRFRAFGLRCDRDATLATASQEYRRTEHEGAPFTIDRHSVTCADYSTCVHGHKCSFGDDLCVAGIAVRSLDEAKQFCAWRGAMLPSYLEWQRAVLGVQGDPFDGSNKPCVRTGVGPYTRGMDRCRFTSDAGVEFGVSNRSPEWTRDSDCYAFGDGPQIHPVAINLAREAIMIDPDWGGASPFADHGEFRCVRDAEPTPR